MPLPPVTRPVERLVYLYGEANRRIFESLVLHNQGVSFPTLLRRVQEILAELEGETERWTKEEIPKAYEKGQENAAGGLVALGLRASRPAPLSEGSALHRDAADALAENLRDDLAEARGQVGRRVRGALRDAQLQAASERAQGGTDRRGARRRLGQLLSERGVDAFRDSRGRRWGLDAYAGMAARTVYGEAQNQGTLNQLSEEGFDLVQITEHSPTCDICAPYQGRVYSISGDETRYPPLRGTAFSGGSTIHPNCAHRVTPYVEELADDPEGDRERSNRPFEDDRPQRVKEAYERGQEKKRRERELRKMYERYVARLGDDAPSLRSLRAARRADGPKWRELQAAYREAGA